MLTWKIVGASKASVLYIYIDLSLFSMVILAVQVLVSLCGLPRHFVRPSEVWFVLDFLQHLVHWFLKYNPDVPRASCLWLPRKVSPRTTVYVLVRPEIPHFLRDNLLLPSTLPLVLLYPLLLVDSVHQLAHTSGEFACQGFP